MSKSEEKLITITDIHPDLTAAEQREAEENLRRYLGLVKRIYEHVVTNNPRILTELRKRARLRKNG